MKPTRVLIIDDSLTMQEFLKKIVSYDPELEIVGIASDPYEARELIKSTDPDVLILDIEMPRMDGLTFLANLMRLRPLPVVMNSSLSQRGSYETIKALELGAFDYIGKPRSADEMAVYKDKLIEKIKRAAKVDRSKLINNDREEAKKINKSTPSANGMPYKHIIGLGASTGGVEALSVVMRQIPAYAPPILIVQHMPPKFSTSFAQRLDETCNVHVYEAQNNQCIQTGCAYLAPGGMQMSLVRKGMDYYIHIADGELVSGHKPSVDVLFLSLALVSSKKISAALLTGMGKDGAEGLKAIYDADGYTIAQDQKTSTVWGMPRSAVELEPRHHVYPLNEIAGHIMSSVESKENTHEGL